MQQLWLQVCGGYSWRRGIWKGVERCVGSMLGFQRWWRSICTNREKKKPDQVLGRYAIYITMNWVTTEICAQSGHCSCIMFWENGFLLLSSCCVLVYTYNASVYIICKGFVTYIYNIKVSTAVQRPDACPLIDRSTAVSGCSVPGMAAEPGCYLGGAHKQMRALPWATHSRRRFCTRHPACGVTHALPCRQAFLPGHRCPAQLCRGTSPCGGGPGPGAAPRAGPR